MSPLIEKIESLISPSIETLGFELVGVEFIRNGKYSVLRVYIDSENGINVNDCSEVSHQISSILDVEDPISNEYTLEVSSPGIERPLFKLRDYQKFLGHTVNIRLKHTVDKKRKILGEITKISEKDNQIYITNLTDNIIVKLTNIDKAHLVYDNF
ncbi:FIG000325: clustered with transcription termination protein NusA [hydrothermal vent metagenome]|uniref:FIG000325: clustered with transcription termination protein NusA n=1 Tax=hydrothermal vent metagenome TaxID=652676 RepID=A0A1W1CJ15_9ZZZZ